MMVLAEQARYGLASIIAYQCRACGQRISFSTSTKVMSPEGNKYWSCNLAAIWGQMATGGGFNKLEESMSVLGVPVMSRRVFVNTERIIGNWWWTLLEESIQAAGRAERELAIQENRYHDGVPAITVIVDAGWSKRTHKHSYNALCGVGVIFGLRTKRLLYIGVRNKFCAACVYPSSTSNHTCFKNWNGSSSSMETDIILNGFLLAEQQHGVRYIKFVGDGDSSVYPTLVAGVPGWGYAIEKQECANHALICFRGHLEQLVKDKPQYKGKNKLTANMRIRLTRDARCAIIMRSKEDDKIKAAILLQEDILNCPMHCFGIHRKCRPEYCRIVRSKYNTTTPLTSTNSMDSSTLTDCSTATDCSSSTDCSTLTDSSTSMDCSTLMDCSTSTDCFASSDSSTSNDCYEVTTNLELNGESSVHNMEAKFIGYFLEDEQQAWIDATCDDTDESVDSSYPVDEQMLCDIKAIASRLASKAQQLLGKQQQT